MVISYENPQPLVFDFTNKNQLEQVDLQLPNYIAETTSNICIYCTDTQSVELWLKNTSDSHVFYFIPAPDYFHTGKHTYVFRCYNYKSYYESKSFTITVTGNQPVPAGVVYTPHIENGILSWTNNGGFPNPDPIDLGSGSMIYIGSEEPQDGQVVWFNREL